MLAQAEGYKKQIEALNIADEQFAIAKLIEALPNIYENIKPEKMFVMGNGDESFNSVAKSIIPFLALLPELKRIFETSQSNIQKNQENIIEKETS